MPGKKQSLKHCIGSIELQMEDVSSDELLLSGGKGGQQWECMLLHVGCV